MTTSSFFHRATIERNTQSGSDAHGHPDVPTWGSHLTLDCRVYTNRRALTVDGNKQASKDTLRIAFRLGEDVTRADRVNGITDRKLTTIYSEVFEIRQITRRKDHYEADLVEID